MNRYIRQLSLPEIDLLKQEAINNTSLLMVGAGGLGAAALPYLAGAGIGHITIIDHDTIDISNLHRQTIYKSDDAGKSKAAACAQYLKALNPDIKITAHDFKLNEENATAFFDQNQFDILLDGSDNFKTKDLLNTMSLRHHIPLIGASVNQFSGQVGTFEGYQKDGACYRCLFPEFPSDARNCNEAGILGTSAGIIGLLQAHITLMKITNCEQAIDNKFFSIDLKTLRISSISLKKSAHCPSCNSVQKAQQSDITTKETPMTTMISIDDLNTEETVIVDVRQPEEIANDPVHHEVILSPPLNIPLPEIISRQDELPRTKRIAFVCAGNIRSVQAAEYFAAKGMDNVCVLDKFSL